MLADTLNLCSKGKSMEYIGIYPRVWMNVTEACYKNLKKIFTAVRYGSHLSN